MNKFFKSVCSVLLAVTMVLTLLPFVPAAATSWEESAQGYPQIYLDTPVDVTVTEENPRSNFYFIPEESGIYFFSSSGNENTVGCIRYDYGDLGYDDDSGEDSNFEASAELTAGETYILESYLYSYGSGSYTVVIEKANIPSVLSVTADAISIIENTNGWQNGDYYYYSINGYDVAVTVTLDDGTTLTNLDEWGNKDYYIHYNGDSYPISISLPQGSENPLLPGNTYDATIYVGGIGATGTFPVTITKSPVVSVTADAISIMENTNGYENGDYYYYSIAAYDVDVTVTLDDGTTLTNVSEWGYRSSSVYYEGYYFPINVSIEQSAENPLLPGNTYEATVSVMGATGTFSVTIVESPIESMSAEPIELIEGLDGSDYGSYTHYNVYGSDTLVTINLKDGSTIDNDLYGGYNGGINFNDVNYHINVSDEQSEENPWLVGNTYTATFSCLGVSCEVPVTIVESPVVSIKAEPIEVVEKAYGKFDGSYYNISGSDTLVTITLNDGSTLKNFSSGSRDNYIYFNNDSHYIEVSLEQSEENPWLAGETRMATFSCLGVSCEVPVTIVESPIESMELLEMEDLFAHDYSYIYNGYPIYDIPKFTLKINFKNGKSVNVKVEERDWYYNAYPQPLDILTSDNQYQIPWTVGGENLITVNILGATTTFNVELKESNYFEYIVQDGEAYITAYNSSEEKITIPDKIDGYTVKGIIDLFPAIHLVRELTIPDSVTYLSTTALSWGNLEVINLGSGIEEINYRHFYGLENLKEVNISPNNKNYASIDGVLYNKGLDTVIYYPIQKGDTYNVPSSVTDISVLYNEIYKDLNIVFDSGNELFVTIDGITYSKDMKIVYSCDPQKTGEYTMPDTVTSIAEFAFSGSSLSKVVISPNVTKITYKSFEYCYNLETVVLPQNIESIEDSAFRESSIKSINLPEGLSSIEMNAFLGTRLEEIVIPGTVKEMGEYCFGNCVNLSKITICRGIEKIGDYAFASWGQGGSQGGNPLIVSLPNTLKIIGESAFSGTGLAEITIPNSVTTIGGSAFSYTNLTEIIIPNSVTTIGGSAFSDTKLTEIVIPNSVTTIGGGAFSGTNITEIVIPDNVTSLGGSAFSNTPLERVVFGKGISYIPSNCFENTNIKSITIPKHITEIQDYAFAECQHLKSIYFEAESVNIGYAAFRGSSLEDVNWESVLKFGDYAFGNTNFTSIVFPENVTEITYGSFHGSDKLTDITLPDSLEKISYNAFTNTAWYKNQPSGWVYLDMVLYQYKGNIETAQAPQIPEGITIIADYSMEDSTFTNIKLPSTLKTIGDYAFHDNRNLKELYIPENVSYIGTWAFRGCSSLNKITISPDNKYFTIKDGALYNKDMTELILCFDDTFDIFRVPETVTKIHGGAFLNSSISYIVFENGDVELAEDSLVSMPTIENIKIAALPTIVCDDIQDSMLEEFTDKYLYLVISDSELTVEKIKLVTEDINDSYELGENIDVSDLQLKVIYSGGSEEIINVTNDMVSGFDSSTAGVKEVTISYKGASITFNVIVEGNATISDKTVRPGEIFDLILNLNAPVNCTSFAISDITYDSSKIELISGEWLVEDLILEDWNSDGKEGVATFKDPVDLEGEVLKLTFKVNDTVEDASFNVDCNFMIKLDSIDIPIVVKSGKITVVNVLPGDLNGDDTVNNKDAIYLLYHTFLPSKYPANQNCDFNGDGAINNQDAIYLLYYTFLPNKYPLK